MPKKKIQYIRDSDEKTSTDTLLTCPQCGCEVFDSDNKCPQCGIPLEDPELD